VTLLVDGRNIRPWIKMINNTAQMKRCHMALHKDYPDTAVDAATTQLLMSSVSGYFQKLIAYIPTAHRSYTYVTKTIYWRA
jgi:hypothetical protein